MTYKDLSPAEVVDNLRQMTGLDHVGTIAHVSTNLIAELMIELDTLRQRLLTTDEVIAAKIGHEACKALMEGRAAVMPLTLTDQQVEAWGDAMPGGVIDSPFDDRPYVQADFDAFVRTGRLDKPAAKEK